MDLTYETLLEMDSRQLHPLQNPATHKNPLVVESGKGVWVHTTDGRDILDAMAGLWNVNIGYGNQELPQVAFEQMSKLAYTSNFAGMTNPPSIKLADRLSGYAYPSLKTTFFTSGGSESNDTAFKTARYYWKRVGKPDKWKIISRIQAYHGITLAATFATGVARYHTMFGPAVPGFLHAPAPDPYRFAGEIRPGETIGQAAARAVEALILSEGPETVAAFIAEPIQGAGGLIVPPDDYFKPIRAICDQYEVLLIIDEVITGFGRTGSMFGLQHYGIEPDIMSFAKGITSGYQPLGGIQINDAISDAIMSAPPAETWMHGYTYSGHATACAVGLKNLEIIERERLVENSKAMGERLLKGLQTLLEFPNVGHVRGLGLIAGVEIVKDKESKAHDPALAAKICDACLERNVRLRPLGNILAMSPGLCINEEEVDLIVSTIGAALDSL